MKISSITSSCHLPFNNFRQILTETIFDLIFFYFLFKIISREKQLQFQSISGVFTIVGSGSGFISMVSSGSGKSPLGSPAQRPCTVE